MKNLPRLHLVLAAGLAAITLWSSHSTPPEPSPRRALAENSTGGFILYQPFNDADGQFPGESFTKNSKQYPVTTVRWVAVGFLRVEDGESEGELVERWYLSKGDATSTVTGSTVPFVEKYFWPGRSSPTGDKHLDWNDLSVRFLRRNDLSGTVDLAAFIEEVGTEYGFALAASAGQFTRYDHTAQKATGY